jgi:60 kDa SS-A/Ro ribonucleoprotein
MKYSQLYNVKRTHQSQPIPGRKQVQNSAGGYVWEVDAWAMLDRFLILGTESGTYYATPRALTAENAANAIALIGTDGQRVVRRTVDVSVRNIAPRNDPAVFVLALCASCGDDATRATALEALPAVCRTGTHLFAFAATCDGLRGWGRGLRKAVGRWYNSKSAGELEYQLVKYAQREGWSNRDLLRLAHPIPSSEDHRALFKWVVDAEVTGSLPKVQAMLQLREETDAARAAQIIRDSGLPREAIPTQLLSHTEVWEALLETMPLTAMIRNLATMTRVGLLVKGTSACDRIVSALGSRDRLVRARIHPMAILIALKTYASGTGLRGSGTWTPVKPVVEALDAAFYTAFEAVEPTGRRYLLGLDVSGSMSTGGVAGAPLTPCEASAAMAMVTVARESNVTTMAFSDEFRPLRLDPAVGLSKTVKRTQGLAFGRTDCAQPMLYAMKHEIPVDAFIVYTDNETWFGGIHPAQALQEYRKQMGINAKLIVVGMTATAFTIAEPQDAGMLDIVGFDASAPAAMNQFVLSEPKEGP